MRNLFIVIFLSMVVLSACTVIIGNYTPQQESVEVKKGCAEFVMPTLPPMPDIPVIPKSVQNNHEASDDILVRNISDLREYIKLVKKEVQTAATKQAQTCQ